MNRSLSIILETMKALHNDTSKNKKEFLKDTGLKIEGTVQDIFKKCKLAPDADAAIHPILADILAGAKLIKNGNEKDGHEKIHHALLTYEDFFDHAGWHHSKEE
ncbi:MAG: hypothetical protein A2Z20_04160 [Bdellovibrionales bacterium RBG_16_40_8]|nr:MAG: hypothetical protein A2Z20_04160 [Bdellovibrionales bacterium RBG_16_40_8]